MRGPADFLDEARLLDVVAREWGHRLTSLRYLPVGGGAYHWAASVPGGPGLFITLDDLATKPWLGHDQDTVFRRLTATYRAAADLHTRGGLPFVCAPILSTRGDPAVRLDTLHSVSVLPFVAGSPGAWGQPAGDDVRNELVHALADLHAAPAQERPLAQRDLSVPNRAAIDDALTNLDQCWRAGPYAEPARQLLSDRAGTLRDWLHRLDVAQRRPTARRLVVSHGEPHPGNLIQSRSGLVLLDWDTLALSYPERDLWMLAGHPDAIDAYTAITGRHLVPELLDGFRLLWAVTDIAAFTSRLRAPHEDTADASHALAGLRSIFDGIEPAPWG